MKNVRWYPVLMALFVCLPLYAQKEDEAAGERQRKIVSIAESLIADARQLTLPENRAVVLASTGSRLWVVDQKRAMNLFEDAVSELLAARAEAEIEHKKGRQNELVTGGSTRPSVLHSIAARNADFALKSLYRTRPAQIERALLTSSPKDTKIRTISGNETHLAQNELALEQALLKMAADQNPERTVALLQAALKKGVTGEALNILRKLHESDPAAAAAMGSDVTSQLIRKGFAGGSQLDYNTIQVAQSFLTEHLRPRPATDKGFRFAASDMKALADKLVAFFLERGPEFGYPYTQAILPIAEKMRPDAVEKLRELNRFSPRRGLTPHANEDYTRLMSHETPIEQIITEAPKIPVEMRRQIYHQAANRLVASGDTGRARQLLSDNFSDEALTNAQESLNYYHAHQLMNNGKFAEAEALINEFPEGNRFAALITLADSAFNRDQTENKAFAVGILGKAGMSIPSPLPTNTELQQMMQLIAAYSRIEPAEAFRLYEGIIPQINELSEATMVLNAFNGAHNIRRGEGVISSGGSAIYFDGSSIRALSQKDFDRALALIGTFARREMRVMYKQQILESL
jgi:hypothetical protein